VNKTGLIDWKKWPALSAGFGAMLCITLLALLDGLEGQALWLMAPFGATMVIVFGLPDAPLAQPKNVILGHLITAFIGIVVLKLFGVSAITLGLAVGLSVAAMLATKTTHPPAGANPIVIMLSGQGWGFLFSPVLIGAVLIVAIGWLYHRKLCARAYPKQWF